MHNTYTVRYNYDVVLTCSDQKAVSSKPKRWKTFRNAFKIPHHTQRRRNSTKRKTIMERLKLRKSNTPTALKIRTESSTEPQLHDRPLSMIDDEIPKDTLEALLDVMPSRSLPASPLVKKRSDTVNFSPPESPLFIDPLLSLPPSLPTSVPVEVYSFTFPETDEKADTSTAIVIDELSTNTNEEATVSTVMDQPSTSADSTATPAIVIDEPPTPNNDAESDPVPKQESSPEVITTSKDAKEIESSPKVTAVKEIEEKVYIWDKIREILHESDQPSNISYDSLPKEEQVWMEHSSGLEQLRAFLDVCD